MHPDPVSVSWHPSSRDADEALHEHISGVLGVPADAVRTGRLCKQCGSDQHGQPWANGDVHVSLARSGPHLVTAVSIEQAVGVDVEGIPAVADRWDGSLVLHDDETADGPEDRAAMWCRKEAILKAAGDGLDVPMQTIRAAEHQVQDLDAPEGYAAAVALR